MGPIILTLMLLIALFAPVPRNSVATKAKWRQIVLMRSTRDDVERLLGQSQYRGYIASYKVEDGMLYVEYYPFNFCASPRADLRVRRWTVVEITHEPDNPPKLADLNLELKKFRKERESPDAPDLISYVDDEEGVDYTFQDDELIDVRYFPARRHQALRCKKATANRRKDLNYVRRACTSAGYSDGDSAKDWERSFYEALEERIKQINLPSLRKAPLRGSDLEVRFWYDARPDIINGFVIRRSADQWSAIGVRQTGENHLSPVKQETLGIPKSGWDAAWKRFLDARILTLPDGSKVNCPTESFGGAFVVETNVSGTYRTYRYTSPQFAKCGEAKRILVIEEIFADEFGLHFNKD